ncbi:MAG: DUF3817 domain-containing protein [Formosa sp.]|nr:DUF3817 domain-containing protein [Formosa sp.]
MNLLTLFRIVAFLEGLSYILLLFVGVPLKYLGNDVTLVKLLGMPHGFLFMAYIAFIIVLRFDTPWLKKHFILIAIASIVPFGTFIVEHKLKKQLK